ncbi:hypothetical protein P280DRAFT_552162 [Massarina eburnea CBS 473.64]|uniref:Uncharacterized protein n=1 Tax=Massarina eburnea CBS 473.64 TaxID=1395130 RepID=A0A6A6RPH9_9PLEO|nr:hypothetical protein P280DRAFT_552162 [Massarina eburnea CBS 473.64]
MSIRTVTYGTPPFPTSPIMLTTLLTLPHNTLISIESTLLVSPHITVIEIDSTLSPTSTPTFPLSASTNLAASLSVPASTSMPPALSPTYPTANGGVPKSTLIGITIGVFFGTLSITVAIVLAYKFGKRRAQQNTSARADRESGSTNVVLPRAEIDGMSIQELEAPQPVYMQELPEKPEQ